MKREHKKLRGTLNPTPISKLLVTAFLAFSLTAEIGEIYSGIIVLIIAIFFYVNKKEKTAIKALIYYVIIVVLFYHSNKIESPFLHKYIFIFIVFIKIFFVPLFAGKFFISTSDVSSMIVSFEKMKFPKVLVIPIAVIFRYFPAFREDKKNIKMAMKMRGITIKNPIKYLEYISIPILISATTIGDDISKSAETKCISDPCKKTRYKEVKLSWIDFVYTVSIVVLNILGRMYA